MAYEKGNYKTPENQVGVGWKKQGKNGEYINLVIKVGDLSYNYGVFEQEKRGTNGPDYRVLIIGQPRNPNTTAPKTSAPVESQAKNIPVAVVEKEPF